MFDGQLVKVIIPALDEEASIALVLRSVPEWVDEIIVVDNGSTDATAATARQAGARVVCEPCRGYGRACLTGLAEAGHCDIIVFLDGDSLCVRYDHLGSFFTAEMGPVFCARRSCGRQAAT